MSEEEITVETYEQGTGKLLKKEKVNRLKAVNPNQDCIDLLSDPTWGSGIPVKIEIVRQVLLKLLES